MTADETLRERLAEVVVDICRKATAHNYGQTVYGYGVHQQTGHFEVHMSSWPRAQEAIRALTAAGFVASDGLPDHVRVTLPTAALSPLIHAERDKAAKAGYGRAVDEILGDHIDSVRVRLAQALRRAEQAETERDKARATKAVLAERERELRDLKGACSNSDCRLHYAHAGPCDIRSAALDGGDPR